MKIILIILSILLYIVIGYAVTVLMYKQGDMLRIILKDDGDFIMLFTMLWPMFVLIVAAWLVFGFIPSKIIKKIRDDETFLFKK